MTKTKTPRLKPIKGWAVECHLGSGAKFLGFNKYGCLSPVWPEHEKERAIEHMEYLVGGTKMKARVARVLYAEPIRI